MVEWIRFTDSMGYVDFNTFLSIPNRLVNYVMTIRAADNLREYKEQLSNTKDKDQRKKLGDIINELEVFFGHE